jgi:hypothetical protein
VKSGDTVRYEAALGPVDGVVLRIEDRLAYVDVDGAEIKIATPRLMVVAEAEPAEAAAEPAVEKPKPPRRRKPTQS